MATGPEHYKEAERLLQEADRNGPGSHSDHLLAAALVRATLAQTAAIAELDDRAGQGGGSATGRSIANVRAWDAAFAREVSSQ